MMNTLVTVLGPQNAFWVMGKVTMVIGILKQFLETILRGIVWTFWFLVRVLTSPCTLCYAYVVTPIGRCLFAPGGVIFACKERVLGCCDCLEQTSHPWKAMDIT